MCDTTNEQFEDKLINYDKLERINFNLKNIEINEILMKNDQWNERVAKFEIKMSMGVSNQVEMDNLYDEICTDIINTVIPPIIRTL